MGGGDILGQLEKPIETAILNYLEIMGVYAWKNQSVGVWSKERNQYMLPRSRHHKKGVADILGIIDGKFLAIEVKSEKGRVSPEQKEFLSQISARGGIAFVARSIEEVEDALRLNEKRLYKNSVNK